jgi:hypothetical protein
MCGRWPLRIRDIKLPENPAQRHAALAKLTQRSVQLAALEPHAMFGHVSLEPLDVRRLMHREIQQGCLSLVRSKVRG